MACGSLTRFCGNDSGFGTFAAEAIPQNGEFVECFGLKVAGLTTEEQRDHTAGSHYVDFVGDAAMTQHIVPSNDGAADDIVEDAGIQTGFVGIQFQYAADVPQPCADICITKTERYGLIRDDGEILDQVDASQFVQRIFVGRIPSAVFSLNRVFALNEQRGSLTGVCWRDSLDIRNNICPVSAKTKETVKKRIEIGQILLENGIIKSSC